MSRLILRIALDTAGRIGPGKIELLERVAEHGSISAAGRAMEMSYKRAWQLIDETQRICGRPVVTAQTGGARGGGAALTPFGEALVRRFRTIEEKAGAAVGADLDALLSEP